MKIYNTHGQLTTEYERQQDCILFDRRIRSALLQRRLTSAKSREGNESVEHPPLELVESRQNHLSRNSAWCNRLSFTSIDNSIYEGIRTMSFQRALTAHSQRRQEILSARRIKSAYELRKFKYSSPNISPDFRDSALHSPAEFGFSIKQSPLSPTIELSRNQSRSGSLTESPILKIPRPPNYVAELLFDGVIDEIYTDIKLNSNDVNEEKLLENVNLVTSGVPQRQTFGLRIAVADFSKKVIDNEGMGISTFTYLEDEAIAPTVQQPESGAKENVDTHEEITSQELENKQKILMEYKKASAKYQNLNLIEKLVRAIKTVVVLQNAARGEPEQSKKEDKKQYSTVFDFQQDSNNGIDNSGMLFDLSYFKARKEKTLSSEGKDYLRTPRLLRTDEHLRIAQVAMTSAVEAFGEFPISMQLSLLRVGWYEKYGPKRRIIRQGHAAQNFYFIISGTTFVSVARQNKATGETYGETVAFLKKGNSFGELALMYGGKRSASVICKDNVELLSVMRDDFIDIFMNRETEDEPDHIKFLRGIHVLNQWPIDKLPYDDPQICLFTYFRRGTVLCRDSNTADWVYIVKSGTCRIIRDLPEKKSTMIKLRSKTRINENIDEISNTSRKRKNYFRFLQNFPTTSISVMMPPASTKTQTSAVLAPTKKVYITLSVLRSKSVFGLEPIAFAITGGTTSVTLVSDGAECVLISKTFFQKCITDEYFKFLRREVQPFPTIDDLEEKLQSSSNWQDYKNIFINYILQHRNCQLLQDAEFQYFS